MMDDPPPGFNEQAAYSFSTLGCLGRKLRSDSLPPLGSREMKREGDKTGSNTGEGVIVRRGNVGALEM